MLCASNPRFVQSALSVGPVITYLRDHLMKAGLVAEIRAIIKCAKAVWVTQLRF